MPEPEISQIEGVEVVVLEKGRARIDRVVHAVRLLTLEVMRAHGLRGLLLEVEIRGDALRDEVHALVEVSALRIDRPDLRIDGASIRLDALADAVAQGLQAVEE